MFGNGWSETAPSARLATCGLYMFAGAFGLATLCLRVPRLRDCASANGIAQTARSESRVSALQRRCALIECLVCFFISVLSYGVLGLETQEKQLFGSGHGCGECPCTRNEGGVVNTFFLTISSDRAA